MLFFSFLFFNQLHGIECVEFLSCLYADDIVISESPNVLQRMLDSLRALIRFLK